MGKYYLKCNSKCQRASFKREVNGVRNVRLFNVDFNWQQSVKRENNLVRRPQKPI